LQSPIAEGQIERLGSKIAKVLTVSIGISFMIPSDKSTLKSLVKQADSALYDAKKNGRNRSEVVKENGSSIY
jgi:diguanylate cyclase (GGDEF)-like protein